MSVYFSKIANCWIDTNRFKTAWKNPKEEIMFTDNLTVHADEGTQQESHDFECNPIGTQQALQAAKNYIAVLENTLLRNCQKVISESETPLNK